MAEPKLDFQLLFENSPDVLLVLLPDAPRYTMVGATRARLIATHTTLDQVIGRGLFELFPDNPEDPSATGARNLRASLDRVLATRADDTMAVQKYDIRDADGTYQMKYWSPKNLPVLSPAGEVQYILHRVEDVTELVQASEVGNELRDKTRAMEREVITRSRELAEANRSLRDANVKLGEFDAAKSAFFSNVSHEFRTPLTLMLGPLEDATADLVEPLGPTQRERVELAYRNTLRLLKLVNTLLDFARLEAGRLRAMYAPADLGQSTAEVAGMFQSAVDKGGLVLVIDSPRLREPVWVDRDMWEKIVSNLLSNAFKFTLEGQITVRLEERDSDVVLEVADTGCGIPEGELPRVFERFYRVAGAAGRAHDGSGIGLSLVRELVELHGGRITVESEIGRGTAFRVEIRKGSEHLPSASVSMHAAEWSPGRNVAAHASEMSQWAETSEIAPPIDQANGAATLRTESTDTVLTPRANVLVVDDNADLRRYISELLLPYYVVTTAPDGLAALDVVRARIPDIVVSDVMMPRLDGFGLVRELRGRPETSSLPIILLSARAGEDASVEGLDTGADDYLVKPFSARELRARVRTHVDLARARRTWIAELERTNRELDAFSYSVSHDLRAPLRAIEGFSRMLVEDYDGVLDAGGHRCVERICEGVQRMTSLIDDLLKLAQITRAPLSSDRVDLTAVARGVVKDLRLANPNRNVSVTIGDDLEARGDRSLLGVVLTNLIGNAWKYTSRVAEARIEVGRYAGEEATFFIRDNGAGFDMAYASKLFAPFQRLHNASEFEGTGVGLATVQRVIARHGGRIWAESSSGRGATFFFSLPTHSLAASLAHGGS
jgi:signal transduction histidine kinase